MLSEQNMKGNMLKNVVHIWQLTIYKKTNVPYQKQQYEEEKKIQLHW